ncbi:Exocyst complex component 7 [Caligus rogercresseyi]|uniref:Exocyst complex component 7 n=1 Tax=Caligus rogercresseyi TaxID=217165 RepID=A0A7T8HIZ9_CALRO|nr:Exocyst complex component 7 [Caligus rogercresseyi]
MKAIEENENLGEQFPEEDSVQNTLIRIAEWLNYNDHDDYMTVYATVRGNVMKKSIDLLRDQYRKPSSPKMDVSTPLSSSNRVSRLSNTINRRLSSVSSRLDISSSSLSKKTPNLPGSAGSTPILSSGSDLNEMEVEIFSQTISGLQKLMASEQRLMVGIIPHSFQQRIFEIIVRDSLDLVLREGEYILLRVKKAVSSHDFLAVITLFLAIRHLSAIAPLMESTLENCDPSVKAKYKSMIHGFFTTGFSALEDFLEVIRGDSTSKEKLPKDGTVFQLTSNVLLFLEQLLEFVDTLAVVLTTQDSSYNQTLLRTETKISVNNRNQALVGLYLDKVLVQLNYTLINKSESYSDQFLKAIFRLNNNQYILRTLNSSGLLRLIDLVQPKRAESYDAMIVEQRQLYLQSWSRILSHIWSPSEDVPIAILQAPGKLGDKYCKMIKDKFAGFNKEMEDISSTQRSYSVPDVELRESLKRDNKEFILHKYQSFYERYVHVQFTKHKEKYIKYTPSQVDHLIDSFFDTAA